MYEVAIAECRNCTIGTAPVTEPGQVEAPRPRQLGGPRGGGRGGGRGADREGEALKVVEHLEVEDLGLGGALGGAGGGHSRPGLEPGGLSHRLRGCRCWLCCGLGVRVPMLWGAWN